MVIEEFDPSRITKAFSFPEENIKKYIHYFKERRKVEVVLLFIDVVSFSNRFLTKTAAKIGLKCHFGANRPPKAKNPPKYLSLKGSFSFSVEPMGERSNFHPEDLIKIFEFIGVVEPYFDNEESEIIKPIIDLH